MVQEEVDYTTQIFGEFNAKIRDIEEKQKVLKERLLLLGTNIVDLHQEHKEKTIEIKKEMELLKQNMNRVLSFLETASSEFSKFAKKEDLEILIKQIKMLQ